MKDLLNSEWFILLNSFAGFYAMVLWLFFAFIRIKAKQWWFTFFTLNMALGSFVVGVTYLAVGMSSLDAAAWLQMLRVWVAPLLVVPVMIHLVHWRNTQKLMHLATLQEEKDQERFTERHR